MTTREIHRVPEGGLRDEREGVRLRLPAHLAPIRVSANRPPRPLTRDEAATVLGRHARTLDRWARLGLLRAIDLGGTIRVPADEAERLLRARGRRSRV